MKSIEETLAEIERQIQRDKVDCRQQKQTEGGGTLFLCLSVRIKALEDLKDWIKQ